MMAGAVIALAVKQPLLVMPLAIASHFLLDALPHFGVHAKDHIKRNAHPMFHYVVGVDIALCLGLLVLLPFVVLKGTVVTGWVIGLAMLCAWLPDAVWTRHFMHEVRTSTHAVANRFTEFHKKIQWFEKPHGMVVEVVWFGGMGVLVAMLAV